MSDYQTDQKCFFCLLLHGNVLPKFLSDGSKDGLMKHHHSPRKTGKHSLV